MNVSSLKIFRCFFEQFKPLGLHSVKCMSCLTSLLIPKLLCIGVYATFLLMFDFSSPNHSSKYGNIREWLAFPIIYKKRVHGFARFNMQISLESFLVMFSIYSFQQKFSSMGNSKLFVKIVFQREKKTLGKKPSKNRQCNTSNLKVVI